MPVSGDVPTIYDVVLNGEGYMYDDTADVRAEYSFSPTFLERQNVSGAFSDNQQDFFLTVSQGDWSGGEQQRFAHVSDPETLRSAWLLTSVDASVPGAVSLRRDSASVAAAAVIVAAVGDNRFASGNYLATATNLYLTTNGGSTLTDQGAHGLGATPTTMAGDTADVWLSTTAGGSVGVRRSSGGFTTWSATASDVLGFHNNSLYGIVNSTGVLQVYSTTGAASTVYTWKTATGAASPLSNTKLCPFGGKLGITEGTNVWLYDGSSTYQIAALPINFNITSLCSSMGSLFIGGYERRYTSDVRPAIYVYTNGNILKLWDSQTWSTSTNVGSVVMAQFDDGLIWNDDVSNRILSWKPSTGAITGIVSYTGGANTSTQIAACPDHFVFHRNSTTVYYYPKTTTVASGSVTTSLFDFDNSLTKQFRGIKVDFDNATDGDGGTVDISYRVGDLDGSYTSLQTNATSGTEYTLTGISGRSISVKVTLNKGTSTNGTVLKKIYIRASPVLQSFKRRTYRFRLSGRGGLYRNILRNGNTHTKNGSTMVVDLQVAAAAAAPFQITDHLGSFNGVIDSGGLVVREDVQDEYIALVTVREV